MTKAGDALIGVDADTKEFKKTLDKTVKETGASVEARFKKSFGRAAALAGGAFLAQKGLQFAGGAVNEARESAKVGRQTEAVIKSTGGAANVTASQVGSYADQLSKMAGVDDELIASGQNVLLTFTNIKNGAGAGNDIFNQTTGAALDMSAALGTDLQGNVMQLGKALNDPVKGMSKLTRAGVTFTDAQKAQVKALVESGDSLGAQKVILKELRKEFGGSAKAAADPMKKLAVAGENLKEKFGTALLPILSKVADGLSKIVEFVTRNSAVIGPLVAIVLPLVAGFTAFAKAATLIAAAQKAWLVIQTALNIQMGLFPVFLIIAGLVALAAGLVVAYKKFDWFHKFVDKVWQAIQVAWGALLSAFQWWWDAVGAPLFRAIGAAINWWWKNVVEPVFVAVAAAAVTMWTWAKVAWDTIGAPTFKVIKEEIEKLKPIFEALKLIAESSWDAIGEKIAYVYENVLKPIFAAVKEGLDAAGGVLGIAKFLPGPVGDLARAGGVGADVAGAKAAGGPVSMGKRYLVGERGPELFVPSVSGSIVPNHALASARSKNITINNYHPASTDVVLAAARRQERLYA